MAKPNVPAIVDELAWKAVCTPAVDWWETCHVLADALLEHGIFSQPKLRGSARRAGPARKERYRARQREHMPLAAYRWAQEHTNLPPSPYVLSSGAALDRIAEDLFGLVRRPDPFLETDSEFRERLRQYYWHVPMQTPTASFRVINVLQDEVIVETNGE